MDKDNIQEKLVETGRKIIKEKGIAYLTARNLSEASGYSVGTIYNQFGNMDNFVLVQNYLTLEALLQKMEKIKTNFAYQRLNLLVETFSMFVLENRNFWLMLFNFHLNQGSRVFSKTYLRHISKIVMLIDDAFCQMYPRLKPEKRHVSTQVLWITLFALSSLLTTDAIKTYSKIEPSKICSFLLNTYLSGLKLIEKA